MANEHNEPLHGARNQFPDREKLKSDTSEVMDKAKQAGEQRLGAGKQTAAAQAHKVAGVFDQASSQFRQDDLPKFAEYASEIGNSIKNFADNLQNRSINDLVEDTRGFARRNPAMFLLGSIALGVAVSRFLKASATHPQQRYESERIEPHRESTPPMSLSDF
jgi:hypothetical protein